jgi:hypothetical protein
MSARWIRSGWLSSVVLLAVLAIGSIVAEGLLEQQRPSSAMAAELSYLPKGQYLKSMVLGYRQVVADLIWIKAVQHFGDVKQTSEGYVWAYHATDVVTDLDPQFVFAYQAAGTVLGVWAGRLAESTAILKKGMQHNPEDWHLPFMLGYDYYFELCDPTSAARYFRIASELPGAPHYLPKLAARMTVEAGDPAVALEFLQRLHEQTRDDQLRESLELRMKEIILEERLQLLEQAVRRYRAAFGTHPTVVEDLLNRGILTQIPPEPFGGVYRINPGNGRVVSSSRNGGPLRVHSNHRTCSTDSTNHAG